MKLELKKEYWNFSIGGGRTNTIKLKDICETLYENLYNSGLSDYFIVSDSKVQIEKDNVLKSKYSDNDTDKSESN